MSDYFNRLKFWKDPDASGMPKGMIATCRPEFYLDLVNVSAMVVDTMTRYAQPGDEILELGCGTGRNLAALYNAGFDHLTGVDISEKAIDLGKAHFPELKYITTRAYPIEGVIDTLPKYDVIFTSGVLMHLPPKLTWVFKVIKNKARHVIVTNEEEVNSHIHAWPRNYRDIFEGKGWRQVEEEAGDKYPPLPASTIKRVFIRENSRK